MRLLASLLLAVTLIATPAVTTGCRAPQSAQQVAYKTLKATILSVNAAEDAFVEAYSRGEVSYEVATRLMALDDKFRASMRIAIRAAQFNYNAPADDELIALATEIIMTIEEVTR